MSNFRLGLSYKKKVKSGHINNPFFTSYSIRMPLNDTSIPVFLTRRVHLV